MKKSISLINIKTDLDFCNSYWTILYGSYTSEDFIPNRSDIDVVIITKTKNREINYESFLSLLEKMPSGYDIKIFELLPLFLKIEIIKSYFVLFGDSLEISEYFYQYRSIWKDMERRYKTNQFINIQEKMSMLENQKKIN